MASDSRALTLKLLADVADFQRKIDQSEKVTTGFSGKVQEFGKKAAVAFAAAGAAAAAYAGKLLVDGVKAAAADQAAQEKLAASLRNTTKATDVQIKATEEYITKTSLAVGITDDELRPSLQRLAIATGDVTKAQNLQKIALDVAAGSGKSLETVTQALSKAYEGNNSALTRLGIGISAAEAKSMSFDEITKTLSNTFKNQASIQADTFQGKMARLQIAFDEAKEAVGARLLPILTNLFDLFTNRVIPAIGSVIEKFRPFTEAIKANKEEFSALWDFLNKFIVPIIGTVLKNAFSGVVTILSSLVSGLGKAINFFSDLYDAAKKVIEFLRNNPLSNFLSNFNPFSNTNFLIGGGSGGVSNGDNNVNFPNVGNPNIGDNNGFDNVGNPNQSPSQAYLDALARKERLKQETERLRQLIRSRGSNPNNNMSTTNVNIGVVGDPEAAARTIIDLLNNSANRGTGGSGALI